MPDDEPPDEIYIGPVGPIPIRDVDPVGQTQDRDDAAVADALHSAEELQSGMHHERAGVRHRVVDRLVARGFDHPNTIPTLLAVLANDPDPMPRFMVAMVLYKFGPDERIVQALIVAMKNDPDHDVRAEAMYSLDQLGLLE
ncbi:HEAT repeat domain-containing protein [Lysinimonas soli]|uniref:HEAT repeat domain-containing protein n=1 Tax=Lysinimonas soli TaxID=1074233 RepID=A0ABW0NT57_9MICO